MPKPIISGNFTIQKMNIKGGWTYVLLPKNITNSSNPFGWCIVKGNIDGYEISQYKLWPTKTGELFLPIKTQIRKKIAKHVGQIVKVELYIDDSKVVIPDDFILCLADYPVAKIFFDGLSDTSKKQFIDHIYATQNVTIQANRIASAISKLEQGKKWHQK